MRRLGDVRVLQRSAQGVDHHIQRQLIKDRLGEHIALSVFVNNAVPHRHVESALAVDRQGNPDQLSRHLINARRLGIEGDHFGLVQFSD